jgi:hypothetical protein
MGAHDAPNATWSCSARAHARACVCVCVWRGGGGYLWPFNNDTEECLNTIRSQLVQHQTGLSKGDHSVERNARWCVVFLVRFAEMQKHRPEVRLAHLEAHAALWPWNE